MPLYNIGTVSMDHVALGMDVMFIRRCTYGRALIGKDKKAHVVEVWSTGSSMRVRVAFPKPLRNLHKQPDKSLTVTWEGFKYTKAFPLSFILDNCKEVT